MRARPRRPADERALRLHGGRARRRICRRRRSTMPRLGDWIWRAGIAAALAALALADRHVAAPRRVRARPDRCARHERGACLRRAARRHRRGADVFRRPVPRRLCRTARAPRDDGASCPRAAHRPPLRATAASKRSPIETIAPGDRLLIRQGDALPVDGVVAKGDRDPRPIGADRRGAAGTAHRRRERDERLDQQGPALRSRGDEARRRRAPTPTSCASSKRRSA